MSTTVAITLITFLYNTIKVGIKFIGMIGVYVKNATLRKKYKRGRDAAREGNVDDLNDIFKDRKD